MLTREELRKSPLFDGHQRMRAIFCHVRLLSGGPCRSFPHRKIVIYDFQAEHGDAVGIIERGEAAMLVRVDEAGRLHGDGGSDTPAACSAGRWPFRGQSDQRQPGGGVPRALRRAVHRLRPHPQTLREGLHPPQPAGDRTCSGSCRKRRKALSERVDVLSRRSIRDKLLCCFGQLAGQGRQQTPLNCPSP
jgi:hypothetical protein